MPLVPPVPLRHCRVRAEADGGTSAGAGVGRPLHEDAPAASRGGAGRGEGAVGGQEAERGAAPAQAATSVGSHFVMRWSWRVLGGGFFCLGGGIGGRQVLAKERSSEEASQAHGKWFLP